MGKKKKKHCVSWVIQDMLFFTLKYIIVEFTTLTACHQLTNFRKKKNDFENWTHSWETISHRNSFKFYINEQTVNKSTKRISVLYIPLRQTVKKNSKKKIYCCHSDFLFARILLFFRFTRGNLKMNICINMFKKGKRKYWKWKYIWKSIK